MTTAPAPPGPTEPLAVWSFVLKLDRANGICCGPALGIAGGDLRTSCAFRMRKRPGLQGRGLAIAGLIIGFFRFPLWLLYIIFSAV